MMPFQPPFRIFVLLLVYVSAVAGSVAQVPALRVVGSDLLPPSLVTALENWSERAMQPLDVSLEGSHFARDAVLTGGADLAFLAVPKGGPLPAGYEAIRWAARVAVIAANEANPVREVSIQELARVYGRGTEAASTWSALGGGTGWSNRSITPLLLRQRDDITFEIFRAHVFEETDELSPSVNILPNLPAVVTRVQENSASLGVFSRPVQAAGVRILFVSDDEIAYPPSEEAVFFGDYPLYLPFFLVFDRALLPRLGGLLDFLASEEVASLLREDGLLPAPVSERQQWSLIFQLSR